MKALTFFPTQKFSFSTCTQDKPINAFGELKNPCCFIDELSGIFSI
jgi:hypothetical protein